MMEMKKMLKFGGRKKFDQGGVARSSDGELIRFGYEDDDEYQKRVNADKAAQGRKNEIPMKTTREAMEEAIDLTEQRTGSGDPRQRPRPPTPLPNPSKPEPEPAKLKTEDTDEADRRREAISKLPQKDKPKPKPVQRKTEESKPPAGAFRGIRSEGANTLPSAFRGAGARGTGTNLLSPEAKMRDINRKKRESVSRDFNLLKDDAGLNFAKGGKVGSASKRGDGIAQRGKTRGKMY